MQIRLLAATLVVTLWTTPALGRDANIVEVRRADAACLLNHRLEYQKAPQDLLFINPDRCPDVPSSLNALQGGAINSGPYENPASRIIVIERRQLRCFFDRLEAAQQSAGSPIVRVDVASCGK